MTYAIVSERTFGDRLSGYLRPEKLVNGRFYYGWVVVAAAFVLRFIGTVAFYSFGTYFEPLSREFGADRGAISLVFALTGLLAYTLGALAGPLADRLGARWLSAFGAAAFLVGLIMVSQASVLWQVYLSYSLCVGVALAAIITPSLGTVQRWFSRRRGFAAGIVMSGLGLGTLIGPLASEWLIVTVGWRMAFLVTGVGAASLVAVAGWFLLRSPAQLSLAPDGDPVAPSAPAWGNAPVRPEPTVREAVGSPEFAWLYLAFALTFLSVTMGLAHLVPFARDAGLDATTATLGLAAVGVGGVTGRPLLGFVADRFGRRRSFGVSMAMIAATMFWWLVLPPTEAWTLVVFGAVFGMVYSGYSSLLSPIIADYFGTRYASSLIGISFTALGLGSFVGPWLGGEIYDHTASYQPAIFVGAVTAALGAVIIFRLREATQNRLPLDRVSIAPASEASRVDAPPDTPPESGWNRMTEVSHAR